MDRVCCIAVDLGASSGRVILSEFDGNTIGLEEVYRFPNEPVEMGGNYYWDFLRLFREITEGIKIAAQKASNIVSLGIDTWGVDYGLLDEDGNLIGIPFHYRDDRTGAVIDKIETLLPFDEIYNKTGIQHMPINTIYQLYSDKQIRPRILNNADALLFIPDLLNYYLTGEKKNEYTVASTSQILNAKSRDWDRGVISKLGLPEHIFQEIIEPGEIYGYLKEDVAKKMGLSKLPVIAVGSHDTASAVVGTPMGHGANAYLSSGTWSLLGAELDSPIINEESLKFNFTNEGGVEDTIRLLKNINGLWIIQQLRSAWSERKSEITFDKIIEAAQRVKRRHFCIDPDDPRFMAPENMIDEIIAYCNEQGQGKPEDLGEVAIAVYNGLVATYRKTIKELEDILGYNIDQINIVGGGTQDTLLCQMTADATGKEVIAGPIEATTIGNTIVQFIAGGYVKDVQEGRNIIEKSFELKRYRPCL